MKKIKYFIIILLSAICVVNVNAESSFLSPWGIEYDLTTSGNGNYTTKLVEADNGYIRIGITNNNQSYISKIDKSGKEIWTNLYDDQTIEDILVDNDKVYIATSNNMFLGSIIELDESSGNQNQVCALSNVFFFVNYQTIIKLYKYDNKIYSLLTYLNIPSDAIVYDPSSNNYQMATISDIPLENITGVDMNLINYSYNNYSENIKDYNWPMYYYWKKGVQLGDYYYMISASPKIDSTYYSNQGLLIKLDKEGNYVSHLVLKDIYETTDIVTNGEYLFISGNQTKGEKNIGYVYTITDSLNIKSTTDTEELYNDPSPTNTLATSLLSTSNILLVAGIGENETKGDGYIWGIEYPYNIKTITNGLGKITVSETAKEGEEVSFTITPEKGYVLGKVKVTDANGNVLTFTSNTFTMPSSDVTIEATFLPENPDTKDMKIITASIILILGSIYGFISLRKYKWLK